MESGSPAMKPELLRARLLLIEDHAPTAEILQTMLQPPVQPETLVRCLSVLLERPRSFVKSKAYAGPDRRRKQATDHSSRRQEDPETGFRIPKNIWIVPPKS
jgi:hypothetical protein